MSLDVELGLYELSFEPVLPSEPRTGRVPRIGGVMELARLKGLTVPVLVDLARQSETGKGRTSMKADGSCDPAGGTKAGGRYDVSPSRRRRCMSASMSIRSA